MEVLASAGAWLAAPTDLVTILNSLDLETPGVKVLKPATLEMMAMITVTPPSDDDEALSESAPTTMIAPALPTQGYGMGLRIFDAPPTGGAATTTFGHTGTLESTHAMFVRRPDGITWAVTISGDYPVSTPEIATIIDNALLFGGFTDDAYRPPPPPLDEG
jgi:D-alanyl-D-alanine carboxypeptidase